MGCEIIKERSQAGMTCDILLRRGHKLVWDVRLLRRGLQAGMGCDRLLRRGHKLVWDVRLLRRGHKLVWHVTDYQGEITSWYGM